MAAMIRNLICKFQICPKEIGEGGGVIVVLMTTFFIYGGDVPSDVSVRIFPRWRCPL